ncbi:MAG: helix-turn-helix transcriptional regulator [Thermomicrobiales bacterium]
MTVALFALGQPEGFRERAGLSQEGLAERAGLSPNAIGALERGERQRPYPHTIKTLADTLWLHVYATALHPAAAAPRRVAAAGETCAAARAATASSPRRASALPAYLTPPIGERELDAGRHLFARLDVRLVDPDRTGGIGKIALKAGAGR